MSRPVYPYPAVARYIGSGDIYDAVNWTKGYAAQGVSLHNWPGGDLFSTESFRP